MPIAPKIRPGLPYDICEPDERFADEWVRDNLAVRVYGRYGDGRKGALVLHFHGGSFTGGDLESGAPIARMLASSGAVVVSLDYPLAPAHPFPAAIEAGYAALEWTWRARGRLAGPRARLFVAGEEAGGNLAAAMALMARDRRFPPLAGQILLSPMLDACLGTASLRRSHAGAASCRWAVGWRQYLLEGRGTDHPYAMPGHTQRLTGLPPALVLTAADDPLRDESLSYLRRLRAAGVVAKSCVLDGRAGWLTAPGVSANRSVCWVEPVRTAFQRFLNGAGDDVRTC
ncbi:MAG: alpha/beta hydrolase [Candidatus Thiodiazotropha sp.]